MRSRSRNFFRGGRFFRQPRLSEFRTSFTGSTPDGEDDQLGSLRPVPVVQMVVRPRQQNSANEVLEPPGLDLLDLSAGSLRNLELHSLDRSSEIILPKSSL
jgi:hypothetical protein